jgi:hypothetical protein
MKKFLVLVLVLLGIATTVVAQTLPTDEQVRQYRAHGIVLPASDIHYRETSTYIEDVPDDDYIHASEAAHEAFRDIKFSVRIHWGVYSKWGIEASWPLLEMSNEKKQEYQNLYRKVRKGFSQSQLSALCENLSVLCGKKIK